MIIGRAPQGYERKWMDELVAALERADKASVKQQAGGGGFLAASPGASVTPARVGEIAVELTSDTVLTFKARGSDGVVRSASLTLAP